MKSKGIFSEVDFSKARFMIMVPDEAVQELSIFLEMKLYDKHRA